MWKRKMKKKKTETEKNAYELVVKCNNAHGRSLNKNIWNIKKEKQN